MDNLSINSFKSGSKGITKYSFVLSFTAFLFRRKGYFMKVLSYSDRIYYRELNQDDAQCIKDDLQLYNTMLHQAYRIHFDHVVYGNKLKITPKYLKEIHGTNDYMPLSAINEAKGIVRANIALNKRLQELKQQEIKNIEIKIKDTQAKLNKLEVELNQLIEKCQKHEYTESDYLYEVQVIKPRIKRLKTIIKMLHFVLNRNKFKLVGLKSKVKQCWFGRNKTNRNDRMLITGRRQGKYCNNLFKYHPEINTMVYRSTNKDIYLEIKFHHHSDELEYALSLPHNTAGKAVAYELRDYGEYFIIKAIIECREKEIAFNKENGVIGVDLNVDHFACVETDGKGNIINKKIIPYDLKGKNTCQRKHLLRQCVKEIVNLCVQTNKPLIIESLDFKVKKTKMRYQNRRMNQTLSEFAYKRIKEMMESKCYHDDIYLGEVDPSYTSQIGRHKYSKAKGLTIHESAALVIARRGQGYSEKVTKAYQSILTEQQKKLSHQKQWEIVLKQI